MRCPIAVVVLVILVLGTAGALLASGCRVRDECEPDRFTRRCGERYGTVESCVKVERGDYLFMLGREHYEVVAISCPGATPRCVESSGRALCRAK
jgi:hypothetical protein